ncbi:MAG: NAD-dependent epimerase/dehydratase family protein [Opitutales bacterium]
MKVLVTGGAGFIGSHVVEQLQGEHEVTVLDNLRSGHLRNLEGLRHRMVKGSILDDDALAEAARGAEVVFHLAAMVSVPESVARPGECEALNVTGTARVLAAARAGGARKVVLASSAAIYGDNPTVPKTESMTPEPRSPYATSKLEGERLLAAETGLSTTSLRFFNVFGPRQDPASAYAAAVPIFIRKALLAEPLSVFGDGGQTRDFVYVKDVVGALLHVAARTDVTGSFNVGYGASITIDELARLVLRLTGSRSRIEHHPARPGDVRHSLASADRLRATGWSPSHTLAEGLERTADWFRSVRG